jgi:Iron-containing redox enzyme
VSATVTPALGLAAGPPLPRPRGPISEAVLSALERCRSALALPPLGDVDPLDDDDLHLALYACYELHYRGFEGVHPELEWEPAVIAARRELERAFEQALRRAVVSPSADPEQLEPALRALVADDDGPPLSRFLQREATIEQFREFMIHRSAYQLKEADPHSWVIPRLYGRPKEALVEVQSDEYGGGRTGRMHATLFAASMRAVGLDDSYGAYLDRLPGSTLATVNLMSLFGLQRRLRGCIVGHLAAFEMTSPGPNRRYAAGLRRLGADGATEFFDEHVEADAVHEAVAAHDLAAGLARQQPDLAGDILFGAAALLHLEARFAAALLRPWSSGATSLRE